MAAKPSIYLGDFSHREAVGWRAEAISKTAWMDLYADLYRAVHGEDVPASEIIEDAERRLTILKANGLR